MHIVIKLCLLCCNHTTAQGIALQLAAQPYKQLKVASCLLKAPAHMQMHMQWLQRQQQQPPSQPSTPQTPHQLPGPGGPMSFAQEFDAIPEGEPSRRGKRGPPAWSRKQQVIEQINELIDELNEIDANIALQVCTACSLVL